MSVPVHLPLANGGHMVVPSSRIAQVDHPVEQGAGFCYVQLTPIRSEAHLGLDGPRETAVDAYLWSAPPPEPVVVALSIGEVKSRMEERDTSSATITAMAILAALCFLAYLGTAILLAWLS